jgi:hypothetical protein
MRVAATILNSASILHFLLPDVGEAEVLRMRSLFAPVLRALPLPVDAMGSRRMRMAFMARHDCWRLSFPLPRLQGLSLLLLRRAVPICCPRTKTTS